MSIADLKRPKELDDKLKEYKGTQEEIATLSAKKQQLSAQVNENDLVLTELRLVKGESVYKQVGPVLVKQDLVDAMATVTQRKDLISNQMLKVDDLIKEQEAKAEKIKDAVVTMQQKLQEESLKAM